MMNSKVARRYLMKHRRSNIQRFPDDWKSLPVPVIPLIKQAPIITQADRMLTENHAGDASLVEALEAEIDTHVFRLYGLTAEEIALIEGTK